MKVTFDGVSIEVEAETAQAAYDRLGEVLNAAGFGWTSDSFHTDGADGNHDQFRDTEELFAPVEGFSIETDAEPDEFGHTYTRT